MQTRETHGAGPFCRESTAPLRRRDRATIRRPVFGPSGRIGARVVTMRLPDGDDVRAAAAESPGAP